MISLKRIAAAVMMIVMLAVSAGCGNSNETLPPSPDEAAAAVEAAEEAETADEVTQYDSEVSYTEPDEDPWKTVVYEYTENGGYQIRATLTYSRIYKWDDETLQSLWNGIGNGNTLPTVDGWGFEHYEGNVWRGEFGTASSENYGHTVYSRANDMYYMVGTLTFENLTEGWDLTPDDYLSTVAVVHVPDNTNKPDLIVSKMFFRNSVETYDSYFDYHAKMTSNKWGPTPFVIGFIENYVPDFPDGQYREQYYKRDRGYLWFGKTKMEMEFWNDEPKEYATTLEFSDYDSFEGITRDELRDIYGEPVYDEADSMIFDGISFLDHQGSLKFFFADNNRGGEYMDCVTWTLDTYDEEMYPVILEELKSYGTYDSVYYDDSPNKFEETVLIGGRKYIIGNERSDSGNWLYVFSPYWE